MTRLTIAEVARLAGVSKAVSLVFNCPRAQVAGNMGDAAHATAGGSISKPSQDYATGPEASEVARGRWSSATCSSFGMKGCQIRGAT